MSELKVVKKPIKDLTVEFNEQMWKVLCINRLENYIELESCVGDKKIIVKKLDNPNIVFYTI